MASSGNFATWNGAVKPSYTNFEHGNTKSDGNTATDAAGANSSIGVGSGKWYAEFYLTVNTTYPILGLSPGSSAGDNRPFNPNSGYLRIVGYKPGASTKLEDNSSIFTPASFGTVTLNQTNVLAGATGDIIGMALDVDNKKLWLSKNGTFMNSGDPAAGSNQQISWTANPPEIFFNCVTYTGGRAVHGNWGQDSTFAGAVSAGGNTDGNGYGDFKYSVPTGFLALCSANLSVSDDIDPAGDDGETENPTKQFNAVAYTGNGSTQSINVGFQPDFLWFKNRGTANSWVMFDSTRGTTKTLNSNSSHAESTGAYTNLDSFTSTGFDLDGGGTGDVNQSSASLLAYCWRANGGTTASNTNGSITSTVQANTKAGFSIITYTGTGSNATIGHGLSSAPDFFIVKDRGRGGESWNAYHSSLGATKYLVLDTNAAPATNSNRWNDTEPTSTTIGLGTNDNTNGSSTYICYAWHGVEGYSKFGIYEGNGNNDGPFIYMGFRPRLVCIKAIDSSQNWYVTDTERETFNPLGEKMLSWNDGHAEFDPSGFNFDVVSNGIKIRSSDTNINSSATFIYMAWGDVPFKYNNTF